MLGFDAISMDAIALAAAMYVPPADPGDAGAPRHYPLAGGMRVYPLAGLRRTYPLAGRRQAYPLGRG